jgi:hypothetical protein
VFGTGSIRLHTSEARYAEILGWVYNNSWRAGNAREPQRQTHANDAVHDGHPRPKPRHARGSAGRGKTAKLSPLSSRGEGDRRGLERTPASITRRVGAGGGSSGALLFVSGLPVVPSPASKPSQSRWVASSLISHARPRLFRWVRVFPQKRPARFPAHRAWPHLQPGPLAALALPWRLYKRISCNSDALSDQHGLTSVPVLVVAQPVIWTKMTSMVACSLAVIRSKTAIVALCMYTTRPWVRCTPHQPGCRRSTGPPTRPNTATVRDQLPSGSVL